MAVALVVAVSGQSQPPVVASPGPSAVALVSPLVSPLPSLPFVTAEPPASLPASSGPSASAANAWPVKGTVARRVRVVRLGISVQIIQGDGIDVPLGKAAHYPGTGWPGSGTNVYLYGHARDGVFIPLWDAKIGDEIQLDLVTGITVRYTITKILDNVAWNDLALAAPTPGEQLTLQTCTSYEPTAPRFVVIAKPITP